jgi:inhibitor of cysteine peptidase
LIQLIVTLAAIFAQMHMASSLLTEADTDTIRVVQLGESVELRLPENPSTGYRWSIDIAPPEAAAVTASHWSPAGAGVGAAGTREFLITIKEAGKVTLRAKLWREWQGEGSVIQRREFTLQVP